MQDKPSLKIEETIKHVLISELNVSPTIIAASDSNTPLLGRGVGLDSMETLTLVAAIEKEFDIEVPDGDLTVELFRTIGTLVEYIIKKTSQ